jgi:hypothetical protein
MHSATHTTCWITAGRIPLRAGTVLSITEGQAVVRLSNPEPMPEQCEIYFTYNCTVGRKCVVESQQGDTIALSFLSRLGAAEVAHNDDIVQV